MHQKNVGRCSVQWIKDSYQHWLGNPNFGEQVLLLLSLPLSYCDHFQCHMSHHPPLLGSWMFWGGQGLNNPCLQIQPINMDHLPFNIVKWFMCNLSKQHLFNKLEQFLSIALWLVQKTFTAISANQIPNQKQFPAGFLVFSCALNRLLVSTFWILLDDVIFALIIVAIILVLYFLYLKLLFMENSAKNKQTYQTRGIILM